MVTLGCCVGKGENECLNSVCASETSTGAIPNSAQQRGLHCAPPPTARIHRSEAARSARYSLAQLSLDVLRGHIAHVLERCGAVALVQLVKDVLDAP